MSIFNEKLIEILQEWDPLKYGPDSYETEIVDVIQAVYDIDDSRYLAKRIQFIYEFSFEEIIPLKECQKVADIMMELKDGHACIN